MNASGTNPPEDDDDDERTVFRPPTPPGQTRPPEDDDEDERTQFAGPGAARPWPAQQPPSYPAQTPTEWPEQPRPNDPNAGQQTDPGYEQGPYTHTGYPTPTPPSAPPQTTNQPSQNPAYPTQDPSYEPQGTGTGQGGYTQDPSYAPQTTSTGYPPAPTGANQAAAEAARATGKLPIGTLINNNYRIEEVLKSGGMGEVYRGIEIHTGDPVAIKAILQEKADDAEAGLLFKREARTLRRLTDETIVRYYNYVPDPELQRYFLVMEFIEGEPLKDYIANTGPLPVEQAKALLARLAGGLATAHDAEVIHRDLSPDNVMLESGRVETARLIDFGIAQSSVVKEATMAGRFAGKFKYVAPEQLGHYGGHISPATDIYGLALLIAAASIGKPLDMGSSIVEAVQSRQSIPDLSHAPEELRPILSYMLEPDPKDRPGSMLEVRELVNDPSKIPERYLGGWVPPAPPPLHTTPPGNTAHGMTQAGTMTSGLQIPGATQNITLNTSLGPTPIPEPDVEKRGGGGLILILLVVFLAIVGGGGFLAWQQGLIGGESQLLGGGGGGNDPTPPDPQPQQTGIPEPLSDTREGFLAAFETGPCTYVTRVNQGPNAGTIEGYSATREQFSGLPTAYEERFGARPEVQPREITRQQCEVLNFAKALQGRGRNGVEMFLSADEVASQNPVTAQLTVPQGQAVWLILISPTGGIFNLSDRLSQPVGNQRNLSFALSLRTGQDPAPQLLLAVESDEPLAQAAVAQRGDQAANILPKILEEIASRNGAASAAVSYLKLNPAEE